ncbi:MAG: S8 family serine peptidase [Chitinispirillaceae bacterium]|nr:S8 family serine peptidase [Chitinispirillaceae bacterium]
MFRKNVLKSKVVFLAVLSLFTGISQAKYKKAEAMMDVPGKKPVMVEVGTTGTGQLTFNYKIPDADLVTLKEKYGGENVKRLYLGNAPLTGDEGKPVLPVVPAQFIVPAGKTIASIEIQRNQKTTLWGNNFVEFGKAKIPLIKGAKFKKTVPNSEIYQNDDPYPAENGSLVTIQKKKGVTIAIVNLNPVQYYPKSGKITIYSNLELLITLKDDNKRLKGSVPVKKDQLNPSGLGVENPDALETYENGASTLTNDKNGGFCSTAETNAYVLITSQSIRDAKTTPSVNDLIVQRQSQGLSATVISIEDILSNYTGVDDAEKVRNFIIDAYTNWNTQYVVLGGDVSIVPYRNLYCEGEYIPSDLYFQCLDGPFNSDGDTYWGEPTDGDGGTDVDLMSEVSIGRISAETPEEMANFIYKVLTYENLPAGTPYLTRACIAGEYLGEQFGPGEFSYATPYMEEIRLGSSASGYTTKGFIDFTAFAEDTLYDKPKFDWGADSILKIINSGEYSIVNHLGHANEQYVMKFYNNEADKLTNINPLFTYSQGCYPGHFPVDCMAEHLTTSTRSGMFAVVFNTVYGYGSYNESRENLDGPSQRFDRQFWDAFFNEFISRIGDLNADSHEDNLWCLNEELIRYCMYETTLFGDPYTMLRGLIQAPSLVYSGQSIADDDGNGDHICNPGESVDLSVTVQNVGSEASREASCILSGNDQYVTVQSASSNLPAINCCGAAVPVSDAFEISVSADCPTPYTVHLTLSVNSGDSIWNLDVPVNVFRSSTISGVVLANTGDTPIPGASVFYCGPMSGSVTTDADGLYCCKLIEGTYSVWANASGFLVSDTMEFSVPPAVQYDFRMYRPLLSVNPSAVVEDIMIDDSLSVEVTLTNNGDANLDVSVRDRQIRKPEARKNPLLIKSKTERSVTKYFHGKKNDSKGLIPNVYNPGKLEGGDLKALYLTTILWEGETDYFSEGVKSIPSIASLDILSGEKNTPNLDYLMQYDCVILSSNSSWADPDLLGDVLADYVDNDKMVILLVATIAEGGDYQLRGRIATPEYMPIANANVYKDSCTSKDFIQHEISNDVKSLSSFVIANSASVQGNGVALGYYSCNNIIAAAYNSNHPILVINVFPVDGCWGGDLIQMVSNSIEWGAGNKWLQVEPENASFSILPGASESLTAKLNSLTLIGGLYIGEISLFHNDPSVANPKVIPVSMTVDGFRSLTIEPQSVVFDQIWYGNTDTVAVTLVNNGSEATTVSSITSDVGVFSCVQSSSIRVKARKSSKVQFVFNPSGIGNFSGNITVVSDAEDNSSITVPVYGTATEGPNAIVSPEALTFTFQPKDVPADRTVVLSNNGAADLGYSIRIRQTGRPVFRNDHTTTPYVKKGLIYNKRNYMNPFVEKTVLVGLKKGKSNIAITNLLNQIGAESVVELAKGINPITKKKAFDTRVILKVNLFANGKNAVLKAIQKLSRDPNVEYAEPDYIVKAINTPNDMYFSQLYGMNNQGQTGGKADADIDAVEAWDSFTGSPDEILVGVIDTGIDYLHPDLTDNIWKNPGEVPDNGIDDDGNGYIDDYYGWDFAYDDKDPSDGYGHGTHCSGTIAGKGNNGIGVTGVMWDAKVMAIKFLDDSGSGAISDAIDAVNYATIMNVNVTNNSWGGGGYSQALEEAIAASGIFIAAAGNGYQSDNDMYPYYPASYTLDNVIAVAATDHNDHLADFSNYGLNSVDLGAPGQEILSTVPNNGYELYSGTSMATPHVTGAVALLWSNNPSLGSIEVKNAVLQSVDKIPPLLGKTASGGRLNIQKMLELAGNGWLTVAPKTPDSIVPSGNREFTITADPEKLEAGQWTADIIFKTDDPFHKDVMVSVTTDVAGCRSISASNDTVNFGRIWENRDTTVNVILINDCNDQVTISECVFNNQAYSANLTLPLYIKPFGNVKIPVRFSPAVAGAYTANMTVSSDAEDNPSLSVILNGVGITPPKISLNPEYLKKKLDFGIVDTSRVLMSNSGEADYHFKAKVKVPEVTSLSDIRDATLFGADWNTIYKIDPESGEPVDSVDLGDSAKGINELAFDGEYIYFTRYNSITVGDPETKTVVKEITFNGDYYFGPIGVSEDNIFVFNSNNGEVLTIDKKSNEIVNKWNTDYVFDIAYSGSRNSLFAINPVAMTIEERNVFTGEVIGSFPFDKDLSSLAYSSSADILFAADWNGKLFAYNPENGAVIKQYQNTTSFWYLAADEVSAGGNWLRPVTKDGVVAGEDSFSLGASFDTRKLVAGTYSANIVLSHTFGLLPDKIIPCTLSVCGEKRLHINPVSLSFDEVWNGRSDSALVYLVNDGNDNTTVSSVITSNTVFSTSFTKAFTIEAFDSIALKVKCIPKKVGTVTGIIKVTSNARDNPLISVNVSVTTVKPPKIKVNPSSISVKLLPGQQADYAVGLKNTGGADYGFKASVFIDETGNNTPGAIYSLRKDGLFKIDPSSGITIDTILTYAEASSIAFDGKYIYLGGWNNLIQIVDPVRKQVVDSLKVPLYMEGLAVTDDKLIVADYRTVYFLDKKSGTILYSWTMNAYKSDFTYCSDRNTLFMYNNDNQKIEEFATEDGKLINSFKVNNYYSALAYSATSRMLMGSSNKIIDYLDPENGNKLGSINVDYTYRIASDEVNASRWLKSSVNSGIVPKDGGIASIGVTFKCSGLYSGVYNGMLIIEHEKGWAPGPFVVNCKLKVKAQKLIEVLPEDLNFGAVAVGTSSVLPVELINHGNDTTTIKKAQSSSKEFILNVSAPFKIPPFSSVVVDATYTPSNPGWGAALFTLKTNASNVSTVIMDVRGQGVERKGGDTLTTISIATFKK